MLKDNMCEEKYNDRKTKCERCGIYYDKKYRLSIDIELCPDCMKAFVDFMRNSKT